RADAGSNTIGGTNTLNPDGTINVLAGNLISGNSQRGLEFFYSPGNVAAGNIIGLDRTGTIEVSNTFQGIEINGATNTTIGGTAAGARNIISGNGGGGGGVLIFANASGNVLQGNYIGTDVTGTTAKDPSNNPIGNAFSGVEIIGAQNNTIGGTAAAARNVIS